MAGTLDHVGVKGALGKEGDGPTLLLQAPSLFLENANELFTDDPAFLLGIDDMGQAGQKTLARIDNDERDMQVIAESTSDLLAFACTQTASIDENAGELTAYGMVNKQGRDG